MLLGAAVAALLAITPKIPHDQTIHVDLGRDSTRVHELVIRWAEAEKGGKSAGRSANIEDWTGEATFRYENGAPRVVEKTTRLADGDYVVEIEASGGGRQSTVMRRDVTLATGSTTTIDATSLVPAEGAPASDDRADAGSPTDGGS